jgi:competence ComEA-like helix-hairpin-helix protein
MENGFKELFSFNTTERNGILVFILLILLISFAPLAVSYFYSPQPDDTLEFSQDIRRFLSETLKDSSENTMEQGWNQFENQSGRPHKPLLFSFNPNTIMEEEWEKLGLKPYQIRIIMNYRAKGGAFKQKKDILKIYGITESDFLRLEPYIDIPVTIPSGMLSTPVSAAPASSRNMQLIDINTADSVELQELRGIGPSFARRIVKYRNLLGGYHSVSQLLEVYGFDQARLDLILNQCTVGNAELKALNINTVMLNDLKKHPYCGYALAKAIIDRRIIQGKYSSADQVLTIPGIDKEKCQKLMLYLTVSEE